MTPSTALGSSEQRWVWPQKNFKKKVIWRKQKTSKKNMKMNQEELKEQRRVIAGRAWVGQVLVTERHSEGWPARLSSMGRDGECGGSARQVLSPLAYGSGPVGGWFLGHI